MERTNGKLIAIWPYNLIEIFFSSLATPFCFPSLKWTFITKKVREEERKKTYHTITIIVNINFRKWFIISHFRWIFAFNFLWSALRRPSVVKPRVYVLPSIFFSSSISVFIHLTFLSFCCRLVTPFFFHPFERVSRHYGIQMFLNM